TIFGTKLSVWSCTWVTACRMLTTRPTARATNITGAPKTSVSMRALRANSTVCSTVIALLSERPHTFEQHPDGEVPAVDHDEQQQLERQGNQDGRQHHHAHAHQNRRHDHVDHQKRQVH